MQHSTATECSFESNLGSATPVRDTSCSSPRACSLLCGGTVLRLFGGLSGTAHRKCSATAKFRHSKSSATTGGYDYRDRVSSPDRVMLPGAVLQRYKGSGEAKGEAIWVTGPEAMAPAGEEGFWWEKA